MTSRLRASAITVFSAYIACVVAGIGYQKMTESVIQSGIQDAHPALAIARAQIGDQLVRFTRLPAVITTVAMGVMFGATVVWGLGLLASAPQVFYGDDGALATNTAISWGIVIAVLGIATAVAGIGLSRGTTPRQSTAPAAA
jgi:hypothetical protein